MIRNNTSNKTTSLHWKMVIMTTLVEVTMAGQTNYCYGQYYYSQYKKRVAAAAVAQTFGNFVIIMMIIQINLLAFGTIVLCNSTRINNSECRIEICINSMNNQLSIIVDFPVHNLDIVDGSFIVVASPDQRRGVREEGRKGGAKRGRLKGLLINLKGYNVVFE